MEERKQRYKYVTVDTKKYTSVAACLNEWAERGYRLVQYVGQTALMELDLDQPKSSDD